MRVFFFVGLVVFSGCASFPPDYYEGTCVNAEGKEITRYMYPITTGKTSLPTTPACDDNRHKTVKRRLEHSRNLLPTIMPVEIEVQFFRQKAASETAVDFRTVGEADPEIMKE